MPQPATRQFSGIFISYRRADSAGHAGRLYDRLSAHFGEDQVFMDVDHIEPGEDFVHVIENGVGSCEILITVIGQDWLLSTDGTSRRLDDPNDFVRLEITAALRRNIRIIPVLVEGAAMPGPQDLPEDLARLSRRQALELSDQGWRHDVDRLIGTLEKVLAERKEARLKAPQEDEERQRHAAAEEPRGQEEGRSGRDVEKRRELEDEEQRKRVEAAALAAAEQKQREAEEERQRDAEESERQRRGAEDSERERREAEEQARDRAAETGPVVRGRHALLAAAACAVLVAGVAAVWLMGADKTQLTDGNVNRQPDPLLTGVGSAGTGPGAQGDPVAPEGMVYAPGGKFTMGRDDGDAYERPAHFETVKPFFIDAHEVTCLDYEKFVGETGRPAPPGWENGACAPGAVRTPVTGVTWDDADAFCRARGKRLPSEAEWEFAARGADGRLYPWGGAWRAGLANAGGAKKGVADVGTYGRGASPFGASDMVGNAWEWTASDMAAYPGGKLPVQPPAGTKVLRGGSYLSNKDQATATYRFGWRARGESGYEQTGFRCVKEIAASTGER